MRLVLKFFNAFIITMISGSVAWCHGVDGDIIPSEGYLVTALYDDGEPMSYAEVEIRSSDSNIPFQAGRTDRNGRIMFKPDGKGNWQVVIKDDMGHRLALDLTVKEDKKDARSPEMNRVVKEQKGLSQRTMGIITGLSVIFGVTGTLYGLKSRRTLRCESMRS